MLPSTSLPLHRLRQFVWRSSMDDWQARIEQWVETHPTSRRSSTSRRSVATVPSETMAPRVTEARRARWGQVQTIAAHQRRFRCHICHTSSSGPYISTSPHLYWVSPPQTDHDRCYGGVEYEQHMNWERPTGLVRCIRCHAWTCTEHLYKQICQTCGYKL